MKKFLLIMGLLCVTLNAQTYKKIKVYFDNPKEISSLYKAVRDLDRGYLDKKDKSLTLFVNEKQFSKIKRGNFRYKVLIEDWQKYFESRPAPKEGIIKEQMRKSKEKFGVKGFSYGSMAGFLTLDEVVGKLDTMYMNYPNIITQKVSLGKSIEGRDIWMVKISDNPNIDEDEPEVFYNALIHAREPQAMMTLLYYMYYLLENYGKDPQVTYLVNNRELYFVPVFNPDGYEYNHTIAPNGGGMWRKNRRDNGNGIYGVDLNRNYGYKWGYDDIGSSNDPSDQTYRGTAPFSEPETEAIRQFCISHHFMTAINFHTYSDLVIFPWGYIPKETPDSLIYRDFGADMTRYNHYVYGISEDIIYGVNGDADDYMYGEQMEKNKIISMTIEVGNGSDGFWPPKERIYPLAQENLYPNLYVAWVAGGYVSLKNYFISQNHFLPADTVLFTPVVMNKGLGVAKNLKFSVAPVSGGISTSGEEIFLDSLSSRTKDTLSQGFVVTIGRNAQAGNEQKFEFVTTMDNVIISRDTISVTVGLPVFTFTDSCNSLSGTWISQSNKAKKWEVTTSDYHSPPSCFTDSKNGDYLSDSKVLLTSNDWYDLTNIAQPRLEFWTKFSLEAGWDFGQVLVTTDGSNWIPLGGKLSTTGSGQFQPNGEPVYNGSVKNWSREEINLLPFAGKKIKLRFALYSDEYVEEDGWYLDDISIFYYSLSGVKKEISPAPSFRLSQNYPNPFNPTTTISYSIPAPSAMAGKQSAVNVTLTVYNALGQKVATLVKKAQAPGNYTVQFDASGLPSGIYFYTLHAGNSIATKKMILMK